MGKIISFDKAGFLRDTLRLVLGFLILGSLMGAMYLVGTHPKMFLVGIGLILCYCVGRGIDEDWGLF